MVPLGSIDLLVFFALIALARVVFMLCRNWTFNTIATWLSVVICHEWVCRCAPSLICKSVISYLPVFAQEKKPSIITWKLCCGNWYFIELVKNFIELVKKMYDIIVERLLYGSQLRLPACVMQPWLWAAATHCICTRSLWPVVWYQPLVSWSGLNKFELRLYAVVLFGRSTNYIVKVNKCKLM